MSVAVVLGLGLLGGLGAIARFLLDAAVSRRAGRGFPYGTFAVNLSGAVALGALVGVAAGATTYRLLGTGLIGAYTTFSTWSLESHRLGEEGRLKWGAANFGVSLLLGLLAAWAGRRLGSAL